MFDALLPQGFARPFSDTNSSTKIPRKIDLRDLADGSKARWNPSSSPTFHNKPTDNTGISRFLLELSLPFDTWAVFKKTVKDMSWKQVGKGFVRNLCSESPTVADRMIQGGACVGSIGVAVVIGGALSANSLCLGGGLLTMTVGAIVMALGLAIKVAISVYDALMAEYRESRLRQSLIQDSRRI